MELLKLEKIKDGKYLKNYELTYRNKIGKEKKYEIVSRGDIAGPEAIGKRVSGVSIVAYHEDKMLLLREFRMGVNRFVYNLCAGMLEEGESLEECIQRELYEETGLSVGKIRAILPPSFAAVAFSDVKTQIAFVEVDGTFEDHTSANEQITAGFYAKEQVRELLETEESVPGHRSRRIFLLSRDRAVVLCGRNFLLREESI